MRNQPPEDEEWAATDRLLSFAEDSGVDSLDEIRVALDGDAHHDAVTATTEAAQQVGVDGTPLLVIDSNVYTPFEESRTPDALDAIVST
jgi:predicted DsbA family dithiol-disulfide isomerase